MQNQRQDENPYQNPDSRLRERRVVVHGADGDSRQGGGEEEKNMENDRPACGTAEPVTGEGAELCGGLGGGGCQGVVSFLKKWRIVGERQHGA